MLALTAELDDDAMAAPSRLPGWNRAMLISHLRYGAEAQLRGVLAATTGRSAAMYPGGEDQRDAEIESGRMRPSRALHDELADVCRRMEDAFASLGDSHWDLPVISRRGAIPIHEVLLQRWLDVEVHMIDLDVSHTFDDTSNELVDAYLPKLVALMLALRRRPDADHGINGSWLLVRSDGSDRWRICADGADARLCDVAVDPSATIIGSGRQLFAVLLGRLDPAALKCTDLDHAMKLKRAFPGP
jgi:maleylpyruvate isomerase